jgi:hypothetical protein
VSVIRIDSNVNDAVCSQSRLSCAALPSASLLLVVVMPRVHRMRACDPSRGVVKMPRQRTMRERLAAADIRYQSLQCQHANIPPNPAWVRCHEFATFWRRSLLATTITGMIACAISGKSSIGVQNNGYSSHYKLVTPLSDAPPYALANPLLHGRAHLQVRASRRAQRERQKSHGGRAEVVAL